MTTRVRLAAFPGYAVERSAGERNGIELVVCRTVRYRRQPDGRSFQRVAAVVGRTPDARAAVNAETELLHRCAGPGIPRVLAAADGTYLTPLLSTDTLGDRLAADGLGPAGIRRVSACLRSAVLALHDAGRVHGRISADAVRFTEAGDPVLLGLRETTPLTAGARSRDLRALDALRASLGPSTDPADEAASPAPVSAAAPSADPSADPAADRAASPDSDPAATVLRELAGRRASRRPDTGALVAPGARGTHPDHRRVLVPLTAGGLVAVGAAVTLVVALGSPPGSDTDAHRGPSVGAPTTAPARSAAGSSGEMAPADAAAPPDEDAEALLQSLVDARTAWVTGSSETDQATVPGTLAASDDAALRSAWAETAVSGWQVRVLEAAVVDGSLDTIDEGGQATVRARLQDSAASATAADGTTWALPASGVYTATITLHRADGLWRLAEVRLD